MSDNARLLRATVIGLVCGCIVALVAHLLFPDFNGLLR